MIGIRVDNQDRIVFKHYKPEELPEKTFDAVLDEDDFPKDESGDKERAVYYYDGERVTVEYEEREKVLEERVEELEREVFGETTE